jgi:hypothetical protein
MSTPARSAGRSAIRSIGGGALPTDELEEALVVLAAGRAAFEVGAHAGDLLLGFSTREFQFDVAVELLEALLAGQLRPHRTENRR